MSTLHGVLPILPTIFNSRGDIDEVGTRNVLDYVLAAGATGVVFPGLASEYDTLTPEERLRMTALVGQWVGGRVPFVIGASAANESDAIRYATAGARAGAQTAMILTPHALANDMPAMARFFDEVNRQAKVKIMLQNAPAPMGIGLKLSSVAALAREVEGIAYVKEEAPPSGQRITELTQLAGDSLEAVFGGAGGRFVIDELARGARGTMPACEITEIHVSMINAYLRGDEQRARDLFERSLPLLNMQANFRWRLTKAVLKRRGIIDCDFVRAPGPALDADDHKELAALLARLSDLLPSL